MILLPIFNIYDIEAINSDKFFATACNSLLTQEKIFSKHWVSFFRQELTPDGRNLLKLF